MKLHTGITALALVAVAKAATYTVTVGIMETTGRQGLGFDPSVILPQAGDTIQFTFQLPSKIKNGTNVQHTATQSSFHEPCTPMEGGFDTGVQTTTMTGGKSFSLLVNDTSSLWFYSYVSNDCNAPMVLAVNPSTLTESAALFQQNAKTATINRPASPSSSSSSEPSKTSTAVGSGATGSNGNGGNTKANGINGVLVLGALFLALI